MKRLRIIVFLTFGILSALLPVYSRAKDIVMATYNLRLANPNDSLQGDGWGQRVPHIADLIRFHGFELFGTQEGFKFMLDDLKERLPDYDYIGVGRDDGAEQGEHAAIFFDKNRFDVIDHGDFWLSETPDRVSFGWDAACRRVCTWGKFHDKVSDIDFVYFNLHMDHIGTIARAESAKLILQKIKDFSEPLPVILSGDFNVDQTSESYKLLNESGIMKDAFEKAEFVYQTTGTFNNFNPGAYTENRIDHIFLSPDFRVKKYGVLTDTYFTPEDFSETEDTSNFPKEVSLKKWRARTPSDHYPVMIVIEHAMAP